MAHDNVLLKTFLRSHPHDAARTIEKLPETMTVGLLEDIEPKLAAQIFEHMIPSQAVRSLQLMNAVTAGMIIDHMSLRDAVRLLRKLPGKPREALLSRLELKKRLQITRQLKYPLNSVAALMNPQVTNLPHDITVADALKRIERNKGQVACEFYVVDSQYRPLGVAYTSALLTAGRNQKLESLANPNIPNLPVQADISEVAEMPEWLEFQSLPVVEKDGSLVGVLSFSDVQLAEAEEELPEATAKAAGLSLLELCWITLTELLEMILVRETNSRKRA